MSCKSWIKSELENNEKNNFQGGWFFLHLYRQLIVQSEQLIVRSEQLVVQSENNWDIIMILGVSDVDPSSSSQGSDEEAR